MSGVSVASSKSLQLEAPQETYDRMIVKLNLILIEDKTFEEAIRNKIFEVMDIRNELDNCSTAELYMMQKNIDKEVDIFLEQLNLQHLTV